MYELTDFDVRVKALELHDAECVPNCSYGVTYDWLLYARDELNAAEEKPTPSEVAEARIRADECERIRSALKVDDNFTSMLGSLRARAEGHYATMNGGTG